MAVVRVRRAAQLTLPVEVRKALRIKEGDYLDARIVKDGVILKPVSLVERKQALANIKKITSRVRDLRPNPREGSRAAEERIARYVKDFRRKRA
jgi:AbrB family looped-hinge helix DNA binding protein